MSTRIPFFSTSSIFINSSISQNPSIQCIIYHWWFLASVLNCGSLYQGCCDRLGWLQYLHQTIIPIKKSEVATAWHWCLGIIWSKCSLSFACKILNNAWPLRRLTWQICSSTYIFDQQLIWQLTTNPRKPWMECHSVSIHPKSRDISRAQKRIFFYSFGCQNNKLSLQ